MQERRELSSRVLGLDNDIIAKLFQLPDEKVQLLFARYQLAHGLTDGTYIREAWLEWKSRRRGISGMNAKRLINLAPAVLSYDDRFELVSKLYKKTRKLEHVQLTVVLGINENGLRELDDYILKFCNKPFEHEWPEDIFTFVGWICDDDAVAAKKLTVAIETESTLMTARYAKEECHRLLVSIKNLESAVMGNHRIELPYGTITLYVRKPSLMEKVKHFFA